MSMAIDQRLEAGALAAASPADPAMASTARTGHWLAGLLDQIDYGLVVLDETADALHVNRAARDWLSSAAAPLRIHGGRIEAVSVREAGVFRRALAGAVVRGWRALLAFDEGGEGVVATVGPLPGPRAAIPGLALLVIGRRHACDALTAQMFASRHGLTPTEAQVLDLLCTGLTPREIARRQGIAVSTVRSHVGNIRSKTRAKSIGRLVREVALLPPSGHALGASSGLAVS
ncbi:helix-turn-helix transcriptional regulator [Scleromatobacter humisilvae]|uniref:Helix-turn-helix transcriptional regulator n=1 Tax=Scleromatobacter humisilvae TaxID=2897159 RepID=A0A9X1YL34_9BURK|nr:helix-turn-helix transcriptional regulator [Scleromatobacter humisilvae]MCK9686713.1 helix-turn-helix transcriptional regulator [Scleromatobacter humisilvae]